MGTFRHMFYQKSNCTPGNISLCSITEITRKANLIISLFRTQMWGEFCWIMWQRGALCCNTAVIEQSWYSYSLQSKFSLYFNLEHFGTIYLRIVTRCWYSLLSLWHTRLCPSTSIAFLFGDTLLMFITIESQINHLITSLPVSVPIDTSSNFLFLHEIPHHFPQSFHNSLHILPQHSFLPQL